MECPAVCRGTNNGADDETISCLILTAAFCRTAHPLAQSAEFASADCVTGLNEIGLISVSNIAGNLQDVERVIALKADEQGAFMVSDHSDVRRPAARQLARTGHTFMRNRLPDGVNLSDLGLERRHDKTHPSPSGKLLP